MHEHKTLVVFKPLMKWEDKLLVESLLWLLTTKVLNTSRHNQTCRQGRQDGGNIFPALIMIPSTVTHKTESMFGAF